MFEVNELRQKLERAFSGEDLDKAQQALNTAIQAHNGQYRLSGEQYIIHPCSVALILLDLGFDSVTIQASLLHDVLEDTAVTKEELTKLFGEKVVQLVDGVTKLNKITFTSKEEEQAENLRKMFFAIAEDVRVLIIKLADRLHNMRTLIYLPEDKRIAFAKETMDIYAPLASRLGISKVKCELEDIAMSYLYPADYKMIRDDLKLNKDERLSVVEKVSDDIKKELEKLNINGQVFGRAKHIYSIYKKMKKQNKTIDQIFDLMAVRVIVDSVKDCYTVLGTIHTKWKPLPGRFKDYIAMPKQNMYQSLHTTVVTRFGAPCEIQIRTFEMNKIAEYGVAAHWKYKEGKANDTATEMEEKLSWLRSVLDEQKDLTDSGAFMDTVKMNIFSDEVFVFTPKGDVYNLPEGSTVVDFAYAIHSAIGNKCVGAKVNSKIVPLNTKVKTGDIVEILTSNNTKGPSRDWLNFVRTASAKNKIRGFFKKEEKEENVKRGKEMLEREAKRRGYNLSDLLSTADIIKYFSKKYSINTLDDLFNAVGYGAFTTNQILIKLIDLFKAVHQEVEIESEEKALVKHKHSGGVIINGYDDFSVRMSHCCNPVPGDEIVGYVSRGRGVSVHCKDCPNVKNMEKERLIEAKWDLDVNSTFTAGIKITADNKSGLLNSVSFTTMKQNISITGANVRTDKDQSTANILLIVEVHSLDELDALMNKLKNIEGVIDVCRASSNL